ncbi:hypothetical protein GCM10027030_14700 [Luteococcus sediminum]|uniref:DUF6504 family protein n=1 Tax=Luteococcus sp. TaxID=1969402 RepID=UPI00373575D0
MMRRCDDVVEVRMGRITPPQGAVPQEAGQDQEGPSLFLWRNRLWRVLCVHQRWIEAGDWWRPETCEGADPLGEREVWRLEAADGRLARRGVYELVHHGGEQWRMRAVLD